MRIETSVPLDDWRAVAPAAKAAEEIGYDGLMSAEISNDPFTPLAFAALATHRIELGTAIAVAFPRSPMVVANVAWDLHTQSGGRFHLGLGAQVKGHNERRFSVPWSAPAPRMREYVESLRAIWRCWERGEPLRYEGEHYRFSLMTPEFSPPPSQLAPIPISIAAVGPGMLRLAGRVCDGVRLHGFATRRYVEEVALPQIQTELDRRGRDRTSFLVWGGGFVATGASEKEVSEALESVRYRIAFYGSTRTYAGVFALHGWRELGERLHAMSKRGQWKEMAQQVPDDVVRAFTAVGRYETLKDAVAAHFGGIADAIAVAFPRDTDRGLVRELLQDLRGIPSPFRGFPVEWERP